MSYNKKIIFFSNFVIKKNFNLYFKFLNNTGVGYIGSYSCGDVFFLQLLFYYFNNYIINFKVKIYGCGSAFSSISIGSLYILNEFYFNIFYLKNYYISEKLSLPNIKFHCSMMFEEILNLSLLNYKNNYILNFF